MKVVERYIMRRTFEMFMAALLWTLAIVWTTQVLARIDLVTDSGQSALTFFEIATLILPSIIPIVVPFAIIIAVAQTLSTMNSDSELVVISAAGSSRSTITRPIIILAALASVFAFAVDNGIDPYARERGRELVAAARADLLSLVIQEGTFRKVDDGLFVQVGERLPDGRLGGIFVADSRQPNVDLVYYAKKGAVVQQDGKSMLVMNDGVVHRKTPAGDVSVIRFTSYAFDLSAFSAAASEVTMYPKDRTLPYLFNPNPNDKIYQNSPQQFRAEIHRRFTESFYALVFALIALAVAGDARSHRESRIHPLMTAVTIALFVRWLGFFVTQQSQSNPLFSPLVYAVPIITSLVAIGFIRSNRTMELPITWAERLSDFASQSGDRMSIFWLRLKGRLAGGSA
ncbi:MULTISPECIES: LPS export ABC transporter permease LptF [unclassified Mesorhizobium]|jgi:lipopolysaccharide export system permease protein|uniref:LPS export ABC transporter permease LptF n=1 Tax=unclassified Mesorhizobium TaxID=325217 RepID=UPI0008DEC669|nr:MULTISPECIES: LPS export ABC transporter permease LptF [unclassified Mesorhizobium]RJG45756.1 LPS export ABC transporter permease LptF [Mesorhizobium sp. DCY119]SFT74314.1 lipopolysaccharide export system permease protein [Mesorhizobium sp. YR577]